MSSLSSELNYVAKQQLARLLDYPSPSGKDWKGLLHLMGFKLELVVTLRKEESPTVVLLEKWEKSAGNEATLSRLIALVEELECHEGVKILRKSKETRSHPLTPTNSVDPSPHEMLIFKQSATVDPAQITQKLQNLAVSGEQEELEQKKTFLRTQRYDVFLSFAREDEDFAEEVRQKLIKEAKLKVFVPSDVMPGKVFHKEIADIIKEGSRKTVIILSPDYLSSEWCVYETNLAVHKSPSAKAHCLIPVLYRKCKIPSFLSLLVYVDYPRHKDKPKELQAFFWNKLYNSVKHVP